VCSIYHLSSDGRCLVKPKVWKIPDYTASFPEPVVFVVTTVKTMHLSIAIDSSLYDIAGTVTLASSKLHRTEMLLAVTLAHQWHCACLASLLIQLFDNT
jgi:hypothetical protein